MDSFEDFRTVSATASGIASSTGFSADSCMDSLEDFLTVSATASGIASSTGFSSDSWAG